jgi:predicted enzyme involved in methoxymalonyl-ACP biosynthesis
LNEIVSIAHENHYTSLVGEYIPTSKNIMVKDHYLNLGFQRDGNLWRLDVPSYQSRSTTIRKATPSVPS